MTGAKPVTLRAILLGLIGAILLCAITPYNDYKIGATYLAGNQFPVGAIFALLLLCAPVNAFLRVVAPKRVFSRAELLTIWTLMLVASGLPSSGLMRFFLPHIAAPQYFSNGVNNWETTIWGGLPSWLTLSDRDAAVAYYTGYGRGAEHIPWGAWGASAHGVGGVRGRAFLSRPSALPISCAASGSRTKSSSFRLSVCRSCSPRTPHRGHASRRFCVSRCSGSRSGSPRFCTG